MAVLGDDACSAEEFVAFNSEVPTTKELTTQDIVANMKASQEEEEEEEEEEETSPLLVLTASKCLDALEEVTRYLLSREHAREMLTHLDAVITFTRLKAENDKKQSCMTDFFNACNF